MLRKRIPIVVSLVAALILLGVVAVMPSLAQNHIAVEPLTPRSAFTDEVSLKFKVKLDGHATNVVNFDDPSLTQVVMFTVQPGAMFPWHSHEGTVVVNVASGALVYVGSEDCLERIYLAGEAFVDPGHGHVHTAYNPGSTPTVLIATFYGLSADGALSTAVPAPADCVVTP